VAAIVLLAAAGPGNARSGVHILADHFDIDLPTSIDVDTLLALLFENAMYKYREQVADVPAWDFSEPGRFSYQGTSHDRLTGKQLQILAAFARAKRYTLTHQEIVDACDGSDERIHVYICELNSALRRCWKLSENPIQPIQDFRAYCLHPPS
jgi:hypothetical protein